MEFKKIKDKILNDIISPFFIKNGFIDNSFLNNGIKYILNKNHITFTIEVFCQTYHNEKLIDNFLIKIKTFLDNQTEMTPFMCFKPYFINFPETSGIIISEIIDMSKLTSLLNNELEKILDILNEYDNVEKIIIEGKKEIKRLNDMNIEKKIKMETNNLCLIKLNEKKIEVINDWIEKRMIENIIRANGI